jgi:gluconate kinase
MGRGKQREIVWTRWEENNANRNRSVVSRELVQTTIDTFETPTSEEDVLVIVN